MVVKKSVVVKSHVVNMCSTCDFTTYVSHVKSCSNSHEYNMWFSRKSVAKTGAVQPYLNPTDMTNDFKELFFF